MFGKKKKNAKDIILEIQRKDKIVSFLTKGWREAEKDGSYYYKVVSPFNKKKTFRMTDIPSEYIGSSGVAHVYTPDLEQFYPVTPIIKKDDLLIEQVLTNEQKEELKKAYRRNAARGVEEGWLKRNQVFIVTLIVMAVLLLSVYFISSNLGSGMIHLGGSMDKLAAKMTGVPLSNTPKPPA